MKKILSFAIITSLLLASFAFAFADNGEENAEVVKPPVNVNLKDINGTKYEAAVKDLIRAGIVDGYPDGSFRPKNNITRAEACKIVINLLGVEEGDLESAPANKFPDMYATNWDWSWAMGAINYAASQGVINGYPDGTFRPAGEVTYAEMVSMLVRALGYKANELRGAWPNNFMDKATELGLLKGVYATANEKAIRGDVALVGQKTLWELEDGVLVNDNILAEYSGLVYGVLHDISLVINDQGRGVYEYEFLFGSRKIKLQTDKRGDRPDAKTISGWLENGTLVALDLRDGVVKKMGTSTEDPAFASLGKISGFEVLPEEAKGQWIKVEDIEDFQVLEYASIYVAQVKSGKIIGYKGGSLKDITKNSLVKMYSITGKNPGVGEIVFVQ